jgi:uncharacterized membrane protein YGL010W
LKRERKDFLENYRRSHQNPINQWLHTIGIPMLLVSVFVFFWDWRWGLGLFALGWILQFAGHWFEGKPPAFFSNPVYLLIGPVWWVKKRFRKDDDAER